MNRLLFYKYVHNVGWEYTYSWVDVYCFSSPLSWKPLHLFSLHNLSLTLAVLYKKSDLFFLLTPVASPSLYSFFTFLACAVAERWHSRLCVAHFILFSRSTVLLPVTARLLLQTTRYILMYWIFCFHPWLGPRGASRISRASSFSHMLVLFGYVFIQPWACQTTIPGFYNFSTSFSE